MNLYEFLINFFIMLIPFFIFSICFIFMNYEKTERLSKPNKFIYNIFKYGIRTDEGLVHQGVKITNTGVGLSKSSIKKIQYKLKQKNAN